MGRAIEFGARRQAGALPVARTVIDQSLPLGSARHSDTFFGSSVY
jgi:hypothetical protein